MLRLSNTPLTLAWLHSNRTYKAPKHIEYLNNLLLDVYIGKIKRLIVSMPPRHGKTELITKTFAAYWLLNRPNQEVRIVSANQDLANDFGLAIRDKFNFAAKQFGLSISQSSNSKDTFKVRDRRGDFSSVGITGNITGKGANLLIYDDPFRSPSDAESLAYRNEVWRHYTGVALPRLEPGGAVVIVMTRWHHDDLVGKVMETQSYKKGLWHHVNIPAIAEENDVLGRQPGEALWAEKYPIDQLLEKKGDMGNSYFSALYQGQPIDNLDIIINPDNFQYYDYDILLPDYTFTSWDLNMKEGRSSDYTVATVWKIKGNNIYLDDMYRKQIGFTESFDIFNQMHAKHKIDVDVIEDKANGSALIDTIRTYTNRYIKPVNPTMSKIVRAKLATPLLENKQVYIRKADWNEALVKECRSFPAGANDDIVDSITQALNYARPYVGLTGAIDAFSKIITADDNSYNDIYSLN